MAKVTITIEDTGEKKLKVAGDFEPMLDTTEGKEPTHAQELGCWVMEMIKETLSELGDTSVKISGEKKPIPETHGRVQ